MSKFNIPAPAPAPAPVPPPNIGKKDVANVRYRLIASIAFTVSLLQYQKKRYFICPKTLHSFNWSIRPINSEWLSVDFSFKLVIWRFHLMDLYTIKASKCSQSSPDRINLKKDSKNLDFSLQKWNLKVSHGIAKSRPKLTNFLLSRTKKIGHCGIPRRKLRFIFAAFEFDVLVFFQ